MIQRGRIRPPPLRTGLLYLVSEDAPSRVILCAGAGCYAQTRVFETEGVLLEGNANTPEEIAARFAAVQDEEAKRELTDAFSQTQKYARKAAEARGIDLPWGA